MPAQKGLDVTESCFIIMKVFEDMKKNLIANMYVSNENLHVVNDLSDKLRHKIGSLRMSG